MSSVSAAFFMLCSKRMPDSKLPGAKSTPRRTK